MPEAHVDDAPRAVVIAHRGASAYAPEHTHASWERALAMGADYIEQDLQMTRDGILVVLHDDTLDRTTRGPRCTGEVSARDWSDLRDCNAGQWFNERYPDRADPAFLVERIPTLADVLERYRGRARFYIETKQPEAAPGMEEALVALLREHGLADGAVIDGLPAVYVQSFSLPSLLRMEQLAPAVPRVLLVARRDAASVLADLDAIAPHIAGLGPDRRAVDAAFVARAHAAGLVLHPYTVNEEADMRRLLDLGVDGMFTDHPDVLLRIR